jgi:hypothetical protein
VESELFKGFNLKIDEDHFARWEAKGETLHEQKKAVVESELNKYYLNDGMISASKVVNSWFPAIDADVFISHSHADSRLAMGMAGWLKEKFGLDAFIDSTVWGYSDELLRQFDDDYCYNKKSGTYAYKKRNKTTSHVNIMLSTALHNMIDACECVIFLNSPNSVSCKGYVEDDATDSPWIFSEISMTRLIERKQKRPLPRRLRKAQASLDAVTESFKVAYDLPLEHLISIDSSALEEWQSTVSTSSQKGPETLDDLYMMFSDLD